MAEKKEYKGIDWFNIKTGETIYTARPAQIKAIIESSDLGVNRQSDMGWRIGPEWHAKLKKARKDRELMNVLLSRYNGDVSESNLMVEIYRRERQAAKEAERIEDEAPFEQEYLDSLNGAKKSS